MNKTSSVHDIHWDAESVSRFWDNMTVDGKYFSDAVGDALIRLAQSSIGGLNGRVLDYGCGPGILLEKLLRRGIQCEGADTSPDSLEQAAKRLQKRSFRCDLTQLRGLPSPFAENSFDVVFFVETIEHILPVDLPQTLSELHRIARPGGHVIVTTPNDENLEASQSVCPECGCRYHRMQHVLSWNSSTIAKAMEQVGWQTVRSKPTFLPENTIHARFKAYLSNLAGRKQKNLVYIGQKPTESGNAGLVTALPFVSNKRARAA